MAKVVSILLGWHGKLELVRHFMSEVRSIPEVMFFPGMFFPGMSYTQCQIQVFHGGSSRNDPKNSSVDSPSWQDSYLTLFLLSLFALMYRRTSGKTYSALSNRQHGGNDSTTSTKYYVGG